MSITNLIQIIDKNKAETDYTCFISGINKQGSIKMTEAAIRGSGAD